MLVLQYPLFKFLIKHLRPGAVTALGLAGVTVAFTAFGAGRTVPWVAVGCLTVVLGEILFVPSFDIWVARKVPADRLAKAMGAMHFFRSAGNMIGSLLAGILFDLALSWDVPSANWYIAALIAAGCAAICLFSGDETAAAVETAEEEREGAAA
ncbi:MFS transporter [Streptomyces sp. 11x1]|uniref:MFS transporter n=1 Tax=Streptomyces sp. 11x1 TaxID=3038642 RepID=UPI00292DE5ED|nr:MFS transporter [Streptomyces sp. 11x1]WNZ11294.1 MFS transporter [Streptomyces sp. 11x1]